MNEPNSLGYDPGGAGAEPAPAPAGPKLGSPSMAQYKFSAEEMRVLQECNRESFFSRSLPLGAALGLGTGAALQAGYLKPNARFGAFPKVTLAVVVGYFLGKLSYQQACAEKLMALPGSYIGQLLRDRRDGRHSGGGGMAAAHGQQAPGSMLGATQADIYSDAGPGSALDLDSDRAGRVFSEDLSRPDPDPSGGGGGGGGGGGPEAGKPQAPLSYEELRRRNRAEQFSAHQDPYRVDRDAPAVRRAPPPPAPRAPPPPVNAYGDSLE